MFLFILLTDETAEPGEEVTDSKDNNSNGSESPASQHSLDSSLPTLVTPTTTTSILTTLHRDRSSSKQFPQQQSRSNTSSPSSLRSRDCSQKLIDSVPKTTHHQSYRQRPLIDSHEDIEHNIPATLIQDPNTIER